MDESWLKLYRKSLNSRVFSDAWMWHLWSWCLLQANWKLSSWKLGREIMPGQFATGKAEAARQLNTTESRWYRGMQKLQEWEMVKLEANNRFTIVTICNWETYQAGDQGQRTTSGQPPDNQRTASEQPAKPIEERKEGREGVETTPLNPPRGKRFRKPSVEEVRSYCQERNNDIDPQQFVDHYDANGWKVGRNSMKDWKAAVRTWERNHRPSSAPNGKHPQIPLLPPERQK